MAPRRRGKVGEGRRRERREGVEEYSPVAPARAELSAGEGEGRWGVNYRGLVREREGPVISLP